MSDDLKSEAGVGGGVPPAPLEPHIQRLRDFILRHAFGGCRMLSQGNACTCPLCDLEKLAEAAQQIRTLQEALDKLQAAYDALTGERFSDRVHVVLKARAESAEAHVVAAKEILYRDAAFQDWAQSYLNAGRWAGHDRSDAIKTELLERDQQLADSADLRTRTEERDQLKAERAARLYTQQTDDSL